MCKICCQLVWGCGIPSISSEKRLKSTQWSWWVLACMTMFPSGNFQWDMTKIGNQYQWDMTKINIQYQRKRINITESLISHLLPSCKLGTTVTLSLNSSTVTARGGSRKSSHDHTRVTRQPRPLGLSFTRFKRHFYRISRGIEVPKRSHTQKSASEAYFFVKFSFIFAY